MDSSVSGLDIPLLPNKALICSLVSTPSRPSYMLLDRVSKSWGKAASQHLQLDGASVTLQLQPSKKRQHEEQRLASLEAWLRQHGHLVTGLNITDAYSGGFYNSSEYAVCRGEAVAEILDALAAAGSWSCLRLQQLQVPAIGSIPSTTIATALDTCRQLTQLQLDANWSTNHVHYSAYLEAELPSALRQLEQLRVLRLHLGLLKEQPSAVSADKFFSCLPSRLEVLELDGKRAGGQPPLWSFSVCISSLQHLVALRELKLPSRVLVECRRAGASLGALTALTRITYARVLESAGQALLALPNLVCVDGGRAEVSNLVTLAGKTALRGVCCVLPSAADADGVDVLGQLTQLTSLRVWAEVRQDPAPDMAAWAVALESLTGLRSLAIDPVVMELVEMAAFTALTRFELVAWWGSHDCMKYVLRGLTPSLSQLARVVLVLEGVEGEEDRESLHWALCPELACWPPVFVEMGKGDRGVYG